MPPSLPLPSVANPILHHERKVWIKGALAGSGFNPGNLLFAYADIGTPVPANTDGGPTNVGPAPNPPNGRIRVWAFLYTANSAAHAAHTYLMRWRDSVTGIYEITMGGTFPVSSVYYPPGGFAFATNGRIQIQYRSSIAGPTFYRAGIWYTIEAV